MKKQIQKKKKIVYLSSIITILVAVGLLLYVQEFSQSNQSLAGQGTRNPNTCSSREYNNCYDNDNGKNILSQGSSLTSSSGQALSLRADPRYGEGEDSQEVS